MLLWLPSLFGLLVCVLCRTRRAAPRAVGSGTRVGLLARPSAAVASAGVRARGSRHAAFVFGGRSHPPAARGAEKPLGGGDGSRYTWLTAEGSDCFETSVSTRLLEAAQCPPITVLV